MQRCNDRPGEDPELWSARLMGARDGSSLKDELESLRGRRNYFNSEPKECFKMQK